MNNSLKLFFLIFNLVPSLTSSVNNFSQPLSETELKMAQNVSEVVERDSKLLLHGGMKVDGMTYSLPQTCQRPCTLSFPVFEKHSKKKGFLTSANCVSTNILVGDTTVGVAVQPRKFDSEQGLDYAFVRVYEDYWWEDDILSDDNSNQIIYSHCAKSGRGIVDVDELLPILPAPSQPLSVGDKVYAHGGARGMVIGEILETGVTITVARPGSCGKESAELHDVVKVKMNKSYYSGDLGAPVYILVNVPSSTQMITSPVGQVVEVYNWNIGTHIWYYIPLDRILKDSGLKLESGDLSYLLPGPEEPDDEDSNNVPLTDNLTASSNASEVVSNQFDKRQNLIIRAGRLIGVSHDPREWRDDDKRCTLGFPVRREGNEPFERGYLMLGDCLSTDTINQRNGVFSLSRPDDQHPPRIGIADTSDLVYRWFYGLDFAIVRLLPNINIFNIRIKIPSTENPAVFRMADIVSEIYFPPLGTRICTTAGYSRVVCGVVTSINASKVVFNPWRWKAFFRTIGTSTIPLNYWRNLIKVRLETVPKAWIENKKDYDRGSPVYWIERNDDQGARVRPVGILYDYDLEYEKEEEVCGKNSKKVYYMYCVSVNLIMLNYGPELRLVGRPPQ